MERRTRVLNMEKQWTLSVKVISAEGGKGVIIIENAEELWNAVTEAFRICGPKSSVFIEQVTMAKDLGPEYYI